MKLTTHFHPVLRLRMCGAITTFPHTLLSRAQTRLCEFSKNEDVLCLREDSAIEAYGGVEVQLHALLTSSKICVSIFRTARSNAHINCLLQNCTGCSLIACKAVGLASSGFESPQWQGISYWTVYPVRLRGHQTSYPTAN